MSWKNSFKYEVDPQNRLIVSGGGKMPGLPKYRKVLDGIFKIDENSALSYHVKSPRAGDAPRQLKLSGNWSLGKYHDLTFTLDKWHGRHTGDELTIKGELIDARAGELSFAVTTRDSSDRTKIYILKLSGAWQADRYNRLCFSVTKKKGAPDVLTFTGAWEITRYNQIVYTYTRSRLKTGERYESVITLKGYWDITEKNRLLYVLDKKLGSAFSFRVSLGKPAPRGLEYEIGIGMTPEARKLTLFGEWKMTKELGLSFEMPYEKGRLKSIAFGAICRLGRRGRLEFRLRNEFNKDLGIDLTLSKKFMDDAGEVFLRGTFAGKEKQILIGAGWMW